STSAQITPTSGAIVEIGSYLGRATIALAQGISNQKDKLVYAVDPLKEKLQKTFLDNVHQSGMDKKIVPIFAPSVQASKSWQNPISLLFIDGDHSYEGVRDDFLSWKSYLQEGGLLVFHDSYFPGVAKLLNEIRTEREFIFQGRLASISYFS